MRDIKRSATFSSSNIWKLTVRDRSGKGMGETAKTYIRQVGYEMLLGREINKESNARPTTWGSILEAKAYSLLPFEYQLVSSDRIFHKEIPYWSGAPDVVRPEVVGDIKCPYSLEVFCDKLSALNEGLEAYKKEFREDYWQLISNAILLESNGIPVTHFEAIIYVPYQSELKEIRDMVNNYDGDANKVAWMNWATDEELPYLLDGGHFKNLNIHLFEIPQEDKYMLTELVHEAIKLLPCDPTTLLAYPIPEGVIVEQA